MAVVGLERTFYNVSESVGTVEVCAVVLSPDESIECPVDFPFNLSLSTNRGTAGILYECDSLVMIIMICLLLHSCSNGL